MEDGGSCQNQKDYIMALNATVRARVDEEILKQIGLSTSFIY